MKILMICEHFHPQTGARALQATKVADALAAVGCEVRVLCGVKPVATDTTPGQRVYAVDFIEAERFPRAANAFEKAKRRFRYERALIDDKSVWVMAMADRAMAIADQFDPDIVMTLSTPFNVHWIGLHLPERVRTKWVAYFSDLWPLVLTPPPYRTAVSCVLALWQKRALRRVLQGANKVIFSNAVAVAQARRAAPNTEPEKYFAVEHIGSAEGGHAPLSRDEVQRYRKRFVHVGKLTKERACDGLIEAITGWTRHGDNGPAFPGFTFVGDVDPRFRQRCRELELSGAVDFLGEVEPAVAQAICEAAGALVVIEAPMRQSPFLPSKFCDYAMLQKPILAICPPGPVRTYLSKFGGGVAVEHDAASIRAGLLALAAGDPGQPGQPVDSQTTLARQFEATRVAQRYLRVFEARI